MIRQMVWLIIVLVPLKTGMAQPELQSLSGETLYLKHKCQICHGKLGKKSARDGYPILAGQNKTYLVNQTIDIRDGVRDNGLVRLMRPLVSRLTNYEIEKIAIFLSKQ